MTEQKRRELTLIQARRLEQAVAIHNDPMAAEPAYMARQLVQVTLPHSNPGDVPVWQRTNGNLTLTIRPSWDTANNRPFPYPYGTVPRLLLFWITTEAVRTKSRRIELGASLAEFMRELSLDPTRGGPRSDAARLRKQMEALFRATISLEQTGTDGSASGKRWRDMSIAPDGKLWWDYRSPGQATLFESWIELGEKFYDAIVSAPVPLDVRALRALRNSSLALDLYSWAVYRTFSVNQKNAPAFVAWRWLATQMGTDYDRLDNFTRKAKDVLEKIQLWYPGLAIEFVRGGVKVYPGNLAVTSKPRVIRR